MKPFPPEMEERIELGFRKAVESVQRGDAAVVLMSLEAFEGDPYLFYTHMWYAYSQGVGVTLAALPQSPPALKISQN